MSSAAIQSSINPPVAQAGLNINSTPTSDSLEVKKGEAHPNKVDFKDLITQSNQAVREEREAKKGKDYSKLSEKEFLEQLQEDTKAKAPPKNQLGKDDFLKLFIEQLKHQDPLNPDKGDEMAAKLAQFNSLEQQVNSNSNLTKLIENQKLDQTLSMLNYVGKDVKLEGGYLKIKNGQVTSPNFDIDVDVASATLVVRSPSGIKEAEVPLGSLNRGPQKLQWDAKNTAGKQIPDGTYSFTIRAKSLTNQDLDVPIATPAKIQGIDLKDQDKTLYTDYGKVGIKDIRAVGSNGFTENEQNAPTMPSVPAAAETNAEPNDNADPLAANVSAKPKLPSMPAPRLAAVPQTMPDETNGQNESQVANPLKPNSAIEPDVINRMAQPKNQGATGPL